MLQLWKYSQERNNHDCLQRECESLGEKFISTIYSIQLFFQYYNVLILIF